MLNYKNYFSNMIIWICIFLIFSRHSYGCKPAIEMSEEDLKNVVGFLRSANRQSQKENTAESHSRKIGLIDPHSQNEVWIWENKESKRIIVAYPDIKTFNPFYKFLDFESEMVNALPYGVTGKVYKKAYDLETSLHQSLESVITQSQEYEYIFSGYGLGGAAAALAASRFASNLHSGNTSNVNLDNRIKVINFSATKIGNSELIENIHAKLKLQNVLHFQRCFDIDPRKSTQHAGIPLEITFLEGVTDNLFCKNSAVVGSLSVGAWLLKPYFQAQHFQNPALLSGAITVTTLFGAAYYLCTWPNIPSDGLLLRVSNYAKDRYKRLESDENIKEIGKIRGLGTRI